jgi:hypothetical protein
LRLAKAVKGPPSFQFYDYGMKCLARHGSTYHDNSMSGWQLAVTEICSKVFKKSVSFIGCLPIISPAHNGSGRLINKQWVTHSSSYGNGHVGHSGQEGQRKTK